MYVLKGDKTRELRGMEQRLPAEQVVAGLVSNYQGIAKSEEWDPR
jgi:hypothetical protein